MAYSLKQKILHALQLYRSLHLVWQASPFWTSSSTVILVVKGILPLLLLYVIKLIIDVLSAGVQNGDPGSVMEHVFVLIMWAGGISVFATGMNHLGNYASEAQSAHVRDHIFGLIQKKSVEVDLAYYENPQYYNTLHRAQIEGPHRPNQIVKGLVSIGQNGISLIAMLGLLITFHWSAAFFLFIAVIPGVAVRLIFAQKLYKWQKGRTSDERKESYYNWVLTSGSCAKEIRLYGTGQFFIDSFLAIRNFLRRERLSLHRQQNVADFCAAAFAVFILMGCFYAIAYRTLTGSISLGEMVMYFQAFQRGLSHLQDLLKSTASLYEDNLFVSHFYEFLAVERQVKDPSVPVVLEPEKLTDIVVENITFRYPGTRSAALRNVSMKIGKGEVIALVGANGAGKSTLVKLLCRLYDPQEGKISLNGIDYRDISQSFLRKQFSAILQDYVQYQLSARENIWLGDTGQNLNSQNIEKAAAKAGADTVIASLPDGFDTLLGKYFENGEELSLGEWQKMALSRAFLRNSPLIIMDEPASSLDPNSEYQIFSQFKKLIKGHSALLISHRLSAVRMADRIYVLSDNTIVESGDHDALMNKEGVYADMFIKQSENYMKD